jgi:hypothetical protein
MIRSATCVRATTTVIASLLLLAGCGSDHISSGACDTVAIDPPSATMFVGDTMRLQGVTSLRNQNGGCDVSTATLLTWTTDAAPVEITSEANAQSSVIISAAQPGTATIHATTSESSAQGTSLITVREH